MAVAYVALGGNQGDVETTFARAYLLLEKAGVKICAVSALYVTEAWPDKGEPNYLNAAFKMKTRLGPWACLRLLRRIERQLGRRRNKQRRYASRPIDLDLIAHGCSTMMTQCLTLPHPRAHLRDFVLSPICDIAPQLRLGSSKYAARSWLECIKSPERSILQQKDRPYCKGLP